MDAVAVGRLEQEHIGLLHWCRIGQDRPAVAAEVAAEEHRAGAQSHPGEGRAEQVAGVDELDLDTGHDRHRPVVAHRLQQRQRALGVLGSVER